MPPRPRLAHLVPQRRSAHVRVQAAESDEELGQRLKRQLLTLSDEAARLARASGDPAQIAAAMRGVEYALRVNGMLGPGEFQHGAPAVVVTVGPDAEAERLTDDDLGTERPAIASQLT